jgi:endonuclease/exonuclease/phosphatase family metal-dependent hydrolase
VLEPLHRDAEPRPAEHARAERVEELAAPVPLRRGKLGETKPRCDELDVRSRGRKRSGEVVVVVRRVGRRVRDDDSHAEYASRVLIRSWNLFHGRTVPSGRRRYFERMVKLVCEDGPTIVALQELAAGTLPRLEGWSGYSAYGDVAAAARLPRNLAGLVTDLDPNRLRSAVEGQANAILVAPGLEVTDHRTIVLNPRGFRKRIAEELGLGLATRLRWAHERRICQAVRVRLEDGRTAVVGNLHATSIRDEKRPADAELLRAAAFVDGLAKPGEPVVLAGDFNVTVVTSPTLRALCTSEWGFSHAGPGLDHVLVRGLMPQGPERHWPENLRRHGDVLLSDHAPVEVEVR